MTTSAAPHLVEALARVAQRRPVARKLIVSPTFGGGRELLRRLSLDRAGWVGFEIVTTRPLATRLAREELERSSLRIVDAFEQQALLDEALDSALRGEGPGFENLGEGVGFREKVHGAVIAMRLSGIGPKELDAARLSDWSKRLFLLRVLQRYERLLGGERRADTASIFKRALVALENEGTRMPESLGAEELLLLPGLSTRGLTGRLLTALQARGAKVLETDPVVGLEVPDAVLWNRHAEGGAASYLYSPDECPGGVEMNETSLFHASSVTDELREVVRRVAARGIAWDQVEIVTPDPAAYGSAMHALSAQLRLPVTYAVGLPVARTRPGRVVRAYLDWIEEGFQAHTIRRLLEAGDLRPRKTTGRHAAAALSRRFRSLRIGWGRKRYRTQIRSGIEAVEAIRPGKFETEEMFTRRRDRIKGELEALQSILFPALKATPDVPDRMGEGGRPVSPAEIARGLRAFLRRVPKGDGADRSARDEVVRVLERVEATLRRRTEFRAAVTILRRYLEIRVRAPNPDGGSEDPGAPWSSEGGHMHLSDLEHGGYTGRPFVFIVGADAERVPGMGVQDPVLLDSDRRVLGEGLPTSSELLRERIFGFAALFARINQAEVTLSYGAWKATEARAVSPSPILLQVLRLIRQDGHLTFEDLHAELGRVVCRIPAGDRPPLDVDDIWMKALGSGKVMRRGVDHVRVAFGRLDAGLTTQAARREGVPGPAHGVIKPRPAELDPRQNPALVLSASRLEDLGTCPLRYLHKSVLKAYPPDDPELDPEKWLDPLRRGGLLPRSTKPRCVRHESRSSDSMTRRSSHSPWQRSAPVSNVSSVRSQCQARVRSVVRSLGSKTMCAHSYAWFGKRLPLGRAGDEVRDWR